MRWRGLHWVLILGCFVGNPIRALAADDPPKSPPAEESPESTKTPEKDSQYATQSGALTTDGGGADGPIDATDKAFAPATDFQLPTADASPSGTLVQSVPIVVLPGRLGRQPPLRLTYASEGPGDGLSGYGWTLDWVTLTRRGVRAQLSPESYTKTIVYPSDGDAPPSTSTSSPKWDTERYQLTMWGAGMELVFNSIKKIFAPRYQNWWRVLPSDAQTFTQWTAQAPDGTTYLFTADAVHGEQVERNIQYIDEIRSVDGQTNMFFTYRAMAPHAVGLLGNVAGVVPEEVQYSCPQRDDPTCYRVEFAYDPLSVPVLTAQHGELIATTERLAHIIVKTPTGGIAVQHDFHYSTDPFNGRSLLTSVVRQDGNGASALPPTTFAYQEAQPPTEAWPVSDAPSVLPPLSYEGQIIDFRCPMYQQSAIDFIKQKLEFASACSWAPTIDGDQVKASLVKGVFDEGKSGEWSFPIDQFYHYGPTILGPWDTGAFFTDLNDDGLPDLVRRFQGPGVAGGQPISWVLNCFNHGNLSFECQPQDGNDFWWSKMSIEEITAPNFAYLSHVPARYRIKREQRQTMVADLEGDRRADVVYQPESPAGSKIAWPWSVKDLDGKDLYDPGQGLPVDIFATHARLLDVNGDGAADVVISNSPAEDIGFEHAALLHDPLTQQYTSSAWKSPVYFYWRVAYDDGWKKTPLEYAYHDLQVQMVDLNGDGLLDIYSMPDAAGRNFNNFAEDGEIDLDPNLPETDIAKQRGIFLNTGSGWADVTKQYTIDFTANATGPTVEVAGAKYPSFHVADYPDWLFLDINGDGLADLVESRFLNLCLGQAGGGWRCLAADQYARPSLGPDDSYVGTYGRLGNVTKKAEALTDDNRRLIAPRYHFVDLDGDQFLDLVENHGVINAFQQTITKLPGHAVLNPLTMPPNILTTTINPLGARTVIGYRPLAAFGHTTGGPRTVVNAVSQWVSPGEISGATLYGYREPAYIRPGPDECVPCQSYDPLRGPEFLGFRQVERITVGFAAGAAPALLLASDQPHDFSTVLLEGEVSRRRQTTHYGTGYAYANAVTEETLAVSHDGGTSWTPISTTTNAWHAPGTEAAPAVSLSPPYLVATASTTVTSHEGPEESISTHYLTYNEFGLPLRIENHGRQSTEDSVTIERFYENVSDPWIVGLLHQETVTAHGQYRTTTTTHNAFGRVKQQQVVASNMPANYITTDYTYDDFGNVLTATALGALPNDPARTTKYTYDPAYHQFLMTVKNPLQQIARTTRYGIDAPAVHPAHFGQVARSFGLTIGTKSATQSIVHTYDPFGRMSTQQQLGVPGDPPMAKMTMTYTPDPVLGTMTTATNIDQQAHRTIADAFGRVMRTEQQGDKGWRVAEVQYGPYSQVRRQSAPHYAGSSQLQWTESDYDPLGRPVLVTTPTQVASYEYPSAFVTRVTDGKGFTQEVERDGQGRVVRSNVAGAETTVYFDNDPLSTIQILDPGGFSTYLRRNGLGMITERIDPDRGTWKWTYDGDGHIITQVDGNGKTTRYRYDTMGRQTQVDWGDDGSAEIRTYYDGATPQSDSPVIKALGQVSAMVDPAGQTRVVYNNLGLPLVTTRQVDGVWHKMAYAYDALGRITEYAHRKAATVWPINLFRVQYGYTLDGLATVSAQMGSAAWQPILHTMQYGEDGQIESQTYGNGLIETFGYAPEGRLLQSRAVQGMAGSPLLRFGYQYDPLDASLTAVTDLVDSAYAQTFQYAADKTLQSATSGIYPVTTYVVQPDGKTSQSGLYTLEYGDLAHPRAVTKATSGVTGAVRDYHYTASGDVLWAGDREFTYNPDHRVTRIKSAQGIMDLFYDGQGAWVKQVTSLFAGSRPAESDRSGSPQPAKATQNPGQPPKPGKPAPVEKVPLIDKPLAKASNFPSKQLIPTIASSTTIIRPFDSLEIVSTLGKATQRRYHVMVGSQRVATMVPESAKATRYYHTDHLGSRVLTTDTAGQPVGKRIGYTPYGSPVNAEKQIQMTGWDDPSQLFTGISLTQVTDLYLTMFRIYDPIIGRFLQPDPIAQAATSGIRQDPYLYAGASPAMFVDPLGLEPEHPESAVIGRHLELLAKYYGTDPDRGPGLTFNRPDHSGDYVGLHTGRGHPALSGAMRDRGRIYVQSNYYGPIVILLHEWGHHLHVDARSLDLYGNFLTKFGKELIAELYLAQHREYWVERRAAWQEDRGMAGYDKIRPIIDALSHACGGPMTLANCSTFTDLLIFGETTFVHKFRKGEDGPGNYEWGAADWAAIATSQLREQQQKDLAVSRDDVSKKDKQELNEPDPLPDLDELW